MSLEAFRPAPKTAGVILLALFSLLILGACQPAADEAPAEEPAEAAEAPAITLTPMPASPEFETAALALTDISAGQNFEPGAVPFGFQVVDYELGAQTSDAATKGIANSGQGQHIHLILNNGPYSAHYEAPFEKELEAGHYVMLAFLSRSYHESLKNFGAAVLTDFTVGGAERGEVDTAAPHLFYSRPKGTYTGADTERLMLDFYLLNTELSPEGNKVRATIAGQEFLIDAWAPQIIEGLEMGEVEVTLELIDAEGNGIPGPFNSVTRTVTLAPAEG
ncbi:MAG: phosphopeptide-binding protein [Acidobacteriota bacterium]